MSALLTQSKQGEKTEEWKYVYQIWFKDYGQIYWESFVTYRIISILLLVILNQLEPIPVHFQPNRSNWWTTLVYPRSRLILKWILIYLCHPRKNFENFWTKRQSLVLVKEGYCSNLINIRMKKPSTLLTQMNQFKNPESYIIQIFPQRKLGNSIAFIWIIEFGSDLRDKGN